jgi:hypothetical protein
MFKRTVTDFNTQSTTQQRLMCLQCTCQLFIMPVVAHLKSHLLQEMNSEPYKCVYFSKLTSTWSASPGPNSLTFTWHMVQCMATTGKCRGFIMHFLNRVSPDYCMFAFFDCHLWETGTFAVNRHSTGQG